MITTSITVAPHLAQYAYAIYSVPGENYIKLPYTEHLYHIVVDAMQSRPRNYTPPTNGNLTIALPYPCENKNPHVHNHISQRSVKLIEKKLNALFRAQLYDFVEEYRYKIKKENIGSVFYIRDCVYLFMQNFSITEITEDALVKSYQRWKDAVRRQLGKRPYNSAKKS